MSNNNTNKMSRRGLLKTAGAGVASTGLAGCASILDSNDENNGEESEETPTQTTTHEKETEEDWRIDIGVEEDVSAVRFGGELYSAEDTDRITIDSLEGESVYDLKVFIREGNDIVIDQETVPVKNDFYHVNNLEDDPDGITFLDVDTCEEPDIKLNEGDSVTYSEGNFEQVFQLDYMDETTAEVQVGGGRIHYSFDEDEGTQVFRDSAREETREYTLQEFNSEEGYIVLEEEHQSC